MLRGFSGIFRTGAWLCLGVILATSRLHAQAATMPRNIILILSDDHRYDFMSFVKGAPPFLQTPNFDRMAAAGAYLANTFVTTSLCTPSRASILTGQYAHRHHVVDNTAPIPAGTHFFPEQLQAAGWHTAYIGKWHMGEDTDDPRPGFEHWVGFRGQGQYIDPPLNIDGERRVVKGYTTDILTDFALAWLDKLRRQNDGQPFFLMLGHKATHAEFVPAPRHAGKYKDVVIPYPATMARTVDNTSGLPEWAKRQRYSWHGVDYAYHGQFDFDTFYRRYTETILGLDESVGRVMDYVQKNGLSKNTLVIYMSDNGFSMGEHGLIDKRHAYEESIRIPMIAWAPGFVPAGVTMNDMVRNIDIMPTVMEIAGLQPAGTIDGRSVLPVLRGEHLASPGELLYEYYWEHAFPHTPTTFALRGDRFKYIYYHGVWDTQELFDLKTDPLEQHNLISIPAYQDSVKSIRKRLWDTLEKTNGMQIQLRRGDWQACEQLLP